MSRVTAMADLMEGGLTPDTNDLAGPQLVKRGETTDPSDVDGLYRDRMFYRGGDGHAIVAHPRLSVAQPPKFDERMGVFYDDGPTIPGSRRYAQEAESLPIRPMGPKLSGDSTDHFPNNQANIVEILEDVVLFHELEDASDRPGLVPGRNPTLANRGGSSKGGQDPEACTIV